MPLLTIFTPTYNRAYLLERIYNSLSRQTNYDFEWLVIDDGSKDNTEQLIQKFKNNNNPFIIRYYKQENLGLIRSFNKGIALASGDFLCKIDSDDFIVDNFMNIVQVWINEIKNHPSIYAVGGLRITPDGLPIKKVWPPIANYIDASDLERQHYDLDADMTECWNLQVLRKYPFPVWNGEKFAPEQIVFHKIALDGFKIRWRAIPLTICEYQKDGLTLGSNKLERDNPMGYAMMYNQMLCRKDLGLLQKFHVAMNHIALSIVGRNPLYIFKSNAISYSLITLIPGIFLSIRRFIQYKKL